MRDKIEGTQWEGHIYAVGGCCRDMALGAEIKDVDLAVDLPSGGVEFARWLHLQKLTTWHPVLFERYGTAMLRLRAFPHDDIEIVQTRAEKYTDHNSRNPETAFGSIEEDCMRRDLTINALYYDITRDKLLDISGRSLRDIRNKVIDTPLDPDSTYDDDPIRILRTVRFASRLGWEVPERVFGAMCRNVHRLPVIKVERLRGEFEKLLLSPNVSRGFELLRSCGALAYIVPEVERLHGLRYLQGSDDTVWQHTLRTVGMLPPDLVLRWAALLHDVAMPQSGGGEYAWPEQTHAAEGCNTVVQVLVRMKYHQPVLSDTLFICANHEFARLWGRQAELMEDAALRRMQYLCGRKEKLDALLALVEADNKALPKGYAMPAQVETIRLRMSRLQDECTEMYTYHLPFAERRIKKILGIDPGPLVEDTLEYMMRMAFANPLLGRHDFERLVAAYTPTERHDYTPLAQELRPCGKMSRESREQSRKSRRKNRKRREGRAESKAEGRENCESKGRRKRCNHRKRRYRHRSNKE